MKIDRNNYEEYFLLYVDNELKVDQKKQVDLFIAQNPDLKEELMMLRQATLSPDRSIIFEDKNLLIKKEAASFITGANYEEWLVLYLDNELGTEQRTTIEQYIATHPAVQAELALFEQTRLEPGNIVFANKKTLYKKEKAKLIHISWLRVAVAAILIVAAGMGLFRVLFQNKRPGAVGTTKEVVRVQKQPLPDPVKLMARKPADEKMVKNENSRIPVNETITHHTSVQRNIPEDAAENMQNTLALHSPVENSTIAMPIDNTVDAIRPAFEQSQISSALVANDQLHKEIISDPAVTKHDLQTPDNSNTSDKDVQYASNTDSKKLRGFFRTAARIIEHNTKINPANDDDRVLIGGMAINLK